ncbi:hypothetical protein [Gemmata massiliana]|uniref:hypothetical protein n=1 Tax=Gemmata massiliana TaxID=1210884 RepID=UPI0013A6F02D|nr:hypothetical protein [Gemmata massiliana]
MEGLPADFLQSDLTQPKQAQYLLALLRGLLPNQFAVLWDDEKQRHALTSLIRAITPPGHSNYRLSLLSAGSQAGEWLYRTLSEKDGFIDDPTEALRLVELVKQEPGFHIIAEKEAPKKKSRARKP